MATGDWNMGTKIEMEPLSCCEDSANNVGTSRLNIRSHTRSQSWTNPPVGQANFTSSLTSIYSVSPLATVFREFFMRSGGQSNHTPNRRENHLNRTFSETSLPRQQVIHSRGNTPPPQEHRTLEGASISEDLPGRTNEEVIQDNVEQPTIGVEISEGVRWMERNAVFIVIVLIKFSFYHRAGLSLILGMIVTFCHCNQIIRKQVSLKTKRQPFILIFTALFLAGNICVVYYTFWDKHLYNCLYFIPPLYTLDFISLLWSIWVTDFIVRFATMGLKALVAAFFVRFLPNNKKRIIYMLLEYFSQFYRNIIPAPLWVRYLSDKQPSGVVFAVIITATYLMIKGVIIFFSIRDLYQAIVSLIRYKLYDRVRCRDQLLESGNNVCPICQEDVFKPVYLKCKHVFCEDCVLQWLDRQNSCPLCRATVPNHNPKWRDGSTSTWPQLF
ncbi:RING finger and transmembrane domain-containing protein 2-like [Halichondria panicea]|uniref:RING finger and transmembrane domain-containing protein 2-like n=1 Tax=Halichondria panicea TaxID=6063 RepID=UPI00312B32AB